MVFDWLILRIPGWSRKVRKLRRNWNRAREKALTKKNPVRKMLLQKLNLIEEKLRMIEEQPMGRIHRRRLAREINIDLAEIKILLRLKEEDIVAERKQIETMRQEKYKK